MPLHFTHTPHTHHTHIIHTPYRVYCGRHTHPHRPGTMHMKGENVPLMSDEDGDGMSIVYGETAPSN